MGPLSCSSMQFIIAAYLRNNITARLRNSLSVLLDKDSRWKNP